MVASDRVGNKCPVLPSRLAMGRVSIYLDILENCSPVAASASTICTPAKRGAQRFDRIVDTMRAASAITP